MTEPRRIALAYLPWHSFSLEDQIAFDFRDVGRALGTADIGLRIQRVEAGRQSSRLHRHRFQEELIYVAEGAGTLRHGDDQHEIGAGEFVHYPAGDPTPHTFVAGPDGLTLFAFGNRVPHEVCEYPEIGTAFVEALDREVPLDGESTTTLMSTLDSDC